MPMGCMLYTKQMISPKRVVLKVLLYLGVHKTVLALGDITYYGYVLRKLVCM